VPDWVTTPFHSWVMVSPELGQVQVSFQPLTAAAASLVMVTLAWKPPGQVPASE
jgi:hypothetical protein